MTAVNERRPREMGPWYAPEEAAPLLGIRDVKKVRALCASGRLACKREGRGYQIPESAITAYNESLMTGPGWSTPARRRRRNP